MLGAISLELSWEIITSVFAFLGILGSMLAIVAWKVWRKWKALSDVNGKESNAKRDKLAREEADLRETLLSRYKGLYELQRDESSRDQSRMVEKCESVTRELAECEERTEDGRATIRQLQEENKRLSDLNIQLQTSLKDARSTK